MKKEEEVKDPMLLFGNGIIIIYLYNLVNCNKFELYFMFI